MDKTLINTRFLECVNFLLSEQKTESKGSIAEKINIKPSKFSEILNKRMSIGLEDLAVFSSVFNFDCNYILLGKGEMIVKNTEKEMTQHTVEKNQLNVAEPADNYKTDLIENLKEQVIELRKDKELLRSLLENKLGNVKTGS